MDRWLLATTLVLGQGLAPLAACGIVGCGNTASHGESGTDGSAEPPETGPDAAQAAPLSHARRFFHQMTAEQAAIAGHIDETLELVEAAVGEGLRDIVRERAGRVVQAWRGPEESVESALARLG
jgi:hypothetical protein